MKTRIERRYEFKNKNMPYFFVYYCWWNLAHSFLAETLRMKSKDAIAKVPV
ncbi:MAG: hypothetical protein ABI267_09850 [Ginsengibacter sp.]